MTAAFLHVHWFTVDFHRCRPMCINQSYPITHSVTNISNTANIYSANLEGRFFQDFRLLWSTKPIPPKAYSRLRPLSPAPSATYIPNSKKQKAANFNWFGRHFCECRLPSGSPHTLRYLQHIPRVQYTCSITGTS